MKTTTTMRLTGIALAALGLFAFAPRAEAAYTDDCITFTSEAEFSLRVDQPTWLLIPSDGRGKMLVSTDKTNWAEWGGERVVAAKVDSTYRLHVRGNANVVAVGGPDPYGCRWDLDGSSPIACVGNIETLRGATGDEPSPQPMIDRCYQDMFFDCELLVSAPTLPATELADSCYEEMFCGCTSLTIPPALPAETLAYNCYKRMFSGCSSLTNAPTLPSTELADFCYEEMFYGCTSLTIPPALPATEFPNGCYSSMFAFTSVDLNASGPGLTWSIPAGTATGGNQFSGMFKGAGGDLQGDPAPGSTYYLAYVPSAITGLVVDAGQLVSGGDVAVTVATDAPGKCNVNFVDIEYTPTLSPPAWRKLDPCTKSRNNTGAVTVEVTMPEGPSGFLRAAPLQGGGRSGS